MPYQKGYSLIELMVVLTIIGILSAIAIPAYQDYAIRAKVTELVSIAGSGKTPLFEAYTIDGAMPGSPAPGSIVGDWLASFTKSRYAASAPSYSVAGAQGLTSNQARVTVTLASTIGGAAAGTTLGFLYTATGSGMAMECSPNAAKNTVSGTGASTTTPERFLPAICR